MSSLANPERLLVKTAARPLDFNISAPERPPDGEILN